MRVRAMKYLLAVPLVCVLALSLSACGEPSDTQAEAGAARVSRQLPPRVVEALKPRAAQLRRQDLELAGERLKVASGR